MDIMPPLAKILIIYGPLGILALIGCLVSLKLYRDARADRKAAQDQLEKERAQCELERREFVEELKKLEERYISKAETQVEKYHDLAKALNQVLDSAFKRRSS